MPEIRDWSYNYSSATGFVLPVPLPFFQEGDLLLAILSSDGGAGQTYTAVSPLKGAASQDAPDAAVDDTADANSATTNDMEIMQASPAQHDAYYYGGTHRFSKLRVVLGTAGVGTWTITWEYWDGTQWTALSGVSDGTGHYRNAAATYDVSYTVPSDWQASTVAGTSAFWIRSRVSAFTSMSVRPWGTQAFEHWTQLFAVGGGTNVSRLGAMYKIALAGETEPTFNASVTETHNGAILAIRDIDPAVPIAASTTAARTVARQAMPSTSSTRNNSLIVYCGCDNATAVVSTCIEGVVTSLVGKDGSAHGDFIAWGFLAAQGSTPGIIASVSGTAYSGQLGTIVVNPPSGGAAAIPTYCAADPSVYVNPIHGVTAYNGDTAFAGTAASWWTNPATVAGRTLANATVTARTDYGINSFRSGGGMSGPTTANTYTGAALVIADGNRPSVAGKNVLVHTMPLIPADLQTVYDTGLGKGLEVGMLSSANNGKVWHLHGFGTAWAEKRVPLVIHPSNTSGVVDDRGTLDTALIKTFGFFTCGFLVSSDWVLSMIWILDRTVVAGGNEAGPIGIPGIVRAVADGHERLSALIQAKNQMLLLQPIQIGDGGTNPVYLDLNSTAIEFPQIYNTASKQTYYCSVDNAAGILYYPGNGETVKHRNSVISSPSRYHWGLHASAHTGANYDFSGLAVIGAGTITLNRAITITGLTINDYSTLDVTGLTLNNSTIKNPPATSASITTGTSAVLNSCDIDVSTLTAGNWWWTGASPTTIFTNCAFTGGGGHALQITASGGSSISLTGNTWTGFGADTTTGAALLFTAESGEITVNIGGGGGTPTYKSAGATITINNQKTLTLTGLVNGSDISIRTSGTNDELADVDENSGTTYGFGYNYAPDTEVDILVIKAGYVPYMVYEYLLENGNASLPIAQVIDRAYA